MNQLIIDTINFFWGCHIHGMWDLGSKIPHVDLVEPAVELVPPAVEAQSPSHGTPGRSLPLIIIERIMH